jgi:hypothetical protein
MKPLLSVILLALCASLTAADKPNILWLTSEDHSPTMGCYGDKVARTPNIDALAAKGMLFKKAWSIASAHPDILAQIQQAVTAHQQALVPGKPCLD